MLITLKRDIRPPTAPVLGTPVVIGTTSIQIPLTTAAADPNGIASYSLEYSTSLNGTYVEATAAAIFPQIVTDLTPSTQYFFRARAVDNFGNTGPYSGIVSATTEAVTPPLGLSWPAHVPGYVSLIPEVGGYGMNTVAGSGRHLGTPATTIILVNSLAATNTGSAATGYGANVFQGTWEYAWRHSASPKVIIPIISGWVTIQDSIPCQTGTPPRPGYVSYYGQFAPGQGLYLRGAKVETNGASNMAIWHLRSYMGDDVTGLGAGARDCLGSGYGAGATQQIALINCDFLWSVDELADFIRSHNQITFANCAFVEPLHRSTVVHPEDGAGVDHGFGPIVGGDTGQVQTSTVSIFRNLFAHTTGRNPMISAQTFVHANNLHYNHGRPTGGQGNAVQILASGATEANYANILGNGFVRGPNNNANLVAVSVTGSYPTGSAGYLFANSQFGWTAPSSQNGFLTSSPTGYAASAVLPAAYPGSWGSGLTAVLQWATNPLAPSLTEWHNFVTLMERTVGAQPIRRTAGRVKLVFDQIRDRLNGVTQTSQFVDTVTEAGGWFSIPSVTINPLNPGSEWHAPLPTGSDRDTPYTSGTFSDGKTRVGYTRLEEWGYEQHLYVTRSDTIAPSVPVIAASVLSSSSISVTLTTASTDAGSGLESYTLERATNSTFTANLVTEATGLSIFPRTVTGLSASTQYFFRARATDSAGNMSANSAAANATTSAASGGSTLTHGATLTISGSGFGTRPDYNVGNHTWQGQRHIHYRWTDFAAGFPANGASQATTEAQLGGFFCGATGLGTGAFDYNSNPSSVGVTIINGGPSQSGKILRKTNIGGGSAEEGYIQFNTTGSAPASTAGFTCFKAKCADAAGGGKVMRAWRDSDHGNFYIGNSSGGTITKEPGPQFTYLSNYGVPGAAFRRYQWVFGADSTLSINGTAIINGSTTSGFSVSGETTTKIMSGLTWQNLNITWPNSNDAGAVYEYTDIYFDFTAARVEVTGANGKVEIQPVNSWADGSITIIGNKGEMNAGTGTVRVYNASNAVIHSASIAVN